MPGGPAIGGAPQQACRLQLRIDVHHHSRAAHGSRWPCRTSVDAAAARREMAWTSDALCTSWSGAAAGPCPAALPSVEHHSKRAGFSCASPCTTIIELLTALDARVVPT